MYACTNYSHFTYVNVNSCGAYCVHVCMLACICTYIRTYVYVCIYIECWQLAHADFPPPLPHLCACCRGNLWRVQRSNNSCSPPTQYSNTTYIFCFSSSSNTSTRRITFLCLSLLKIRISLKIGQGKLGTCIYVHVCTHVPLSTGR